MDILSHGLWGALAAKAFNKKSDALTRRGKASLNPLLAFVWGIVPDFVAFTPIFVFIAWGTATGTFDLSQFSRAEAFAHLRTTMPFLMELTGTIYNITHSAVMFALFFALVSAVRRLILPVGHPLRRMPWEMGAWFLHILVDIPTHSHAFYPTPFLWPLSDFHVNGIPWAHPVIFTPNLIGLLLAYLWVRKSKHVARVS